MFLRITSRSSHLKIGVLTEKQRQGIKSHTFRSIINCYAADQTFCEYEYRERVVYVYWNYRDEGSVSKRLEHLCLKEAKKFAVFMLYLFKKNAKTRLRY